MIRTIVPTTVLRYLSSKATLSWVRSLSPNPAVLKDAFKRALTAQLMTDDAKIYNKAGKQFAIHSTVNHSAKEYARGEVTTNTVESSFAILKRGLTGTGNVTTQPFTA